MAFDSKVVIKSIVDSAAKPFLKSLGYRKRSLTWTKQEAELTKVVNIQLSRHNTKAGSSFTINLGAYHAEYHREQGLPAASDPPKEYDCHARMRIGQLMGVGDHWWTVEDGLEIEPVQNDFARTLEKHVPAWDASFHRLEDIKRYFVRHEQFFNAAVACHLLDPAAQTYLQNAVKEANPHFKVRIVSWAEENGYDLPVVDSG